MEDWPKGKEAEAEDDMRQRYMSVLVTGGTGFIGSHLVRRLVEDEVAVTALVRATSDPSTFPAGAFVEQF